MKRRYPYGRGKKKEKTRKGKKARQWQIEQIIRVKYDAN